MGSPPMNLIHARRAAGAVAFDGGAVAVPDALGQGPVVLGVRPEHVHVRGSAWSPPEPDGAAFDAQIDAVEIVGDQQILLLRAGATMACRVEPAFPARAGDRVHAWIDPRRVHLFDSATGSALWHARH
ncbi:MAG: TOBE domain-containing protein, partial [Actinomycetota bacterium]